MSDGPQTIGVSALADTVERLLRECEDVPATRSIALRVLHLIDEDRESLTTIGMAAASDPGLAGRLLRMANSAYYGLTQRVASVPYAVVVVGLSTLRSMAAATVLEEVVGDTGLPPQFWEHAMSTAVAAGTLARRMLVDANDAFSAGILHDVGGALLYRADAEAYDGISAEVGHETPEGCAREAEVFGLAHPRVGARVLEAWRVPGWLCDVVAHHHSRPLPADADTPLARCVQVAEIVATQLDIFGGEQPAAPPPADLRLLARVGIESDALPGVVRDVRMAALDMISLL